ncbi:FHA domain-containing protein [Neosynechococcus sphagnicola]|uniref:FHA domain-containing protein n=1 Tax=Neosynechococcus sphagnicola TaxID=1501145 RepID=UPI001EFA05DF|nr:FHA domain-containing protein [Neosynechococcus sphagnicola]
MTGIPDGTAFLRLLTANLQGQSSRYYPLSPAQEVVIGRDPSCQIVLDSGQYGGVSRRHLALRPLQPGTWQVCDLESANGTYVNDQRLQDCRLLKSGDRITLGQKVVEFCFEIQKSMPLLIPEPLEEATHAPGTTASLSLSQLLPILSTGGDLTRKAFLIPGILTVLFVVLMFISSDDFGVFALVLALYLSGAA